MRIRYDSGMHESHVVSVVVEASNKSKIVWYEAVQCSANTWRRIHLKRAKRVGRAGRGFVEGLDNTSFRDALKKSLFTLVALAALVTWIQLRTWAALLTWIQL